VWRTADIATAHRHARGAYTSPTIAASTPPEPPISSAGLPDDATFAHKTGNLVGVLHAAGVLTLADGRVVYVTVLTAGDYIASQGFLRDLAFTLTLALGNYSGLQSDWPAGKLGR